MRRRTPSWRRHRALMLGFVLAAALVVFFAVRLISSALFWADPDHRRVTPEGWMTPGFVARSWHVPREAIPDLFGLPPEALKGRTLAQIAAARGEPLPDFLSSLRAALDRAAEAAP